MKQKLLTDIELDVHEMNYLMVSFSKEPTQALHELLKRNIRQMQGRLEQLLQELDSESQTISVEPVESKIIVQEKKLVQEKVVVPEEIVVLEELVVTVLKESASPVLVENIRKESGLRQYISLNDSFRFTRELFSGDSELMNRVVEQISAMSSLNASIAFLSTKVKITEEDEAVNDFLEILKKYFKSA